MNPHPPHQESFRRTRPATDLAGLLVFLMLSFAVAWVGATFTMSGVGAWYDGLQKPAWNPPKWLFGPVWTALYVLIAVAGWLVWRRAGFTRGSLALGLFALQLLLNAAWSALFFTLRAPGPAFAEIVLLWLAIGATTAAFANHSRTAAVLMTPYLLWVSFAAVLNFVIWTLNP